MAIIFSCPACERELKVKDELAGRKIRCPACKEVITVVAQAEESRVSATPLKKKPRAEVDEDSDEPEEEERPRKKKKKKKKKSNQGLLIGLAVVALLLVIAGIVFMMFQGGGHSAPKVAEKPKIEEPPEAPKEPPKKPPVGGLGRVMERAEAQNILRNLGLAFKNYELTNNRGPAKRQELSSFYENHPRFNEALDKKWITFIWGASSLTMPQGTSKTILAYETDADRLGFRMVLMGDGTVVGMDEATFQVAPKAMGK